MKTSDKNSMWVGLIANPLAGRGKGLQRVEEMESMLRAKGIRVERALTPEARALMVRQASHQPESRKVLVAIGGDGTVNALINEFPDVPICNYASGTENLFARAIKPEQSAKAIVDWMVQAQYRHMDLGEFSIQDTSINPQSRRFALMLGFGFDAAVVNRHHARRVAGTGLARPTSRLAYVQPLAYEAWNYRFPPVRLSWTNTDGKTIQQVGTTCILFNMDCYAIGLRFTPGATAFDGMLDSVSFSKKGSIQAGLYFGAVLFGFHPLLKSVELERMKEVKVEALESPVPVQMDGDPAGYLEPGKPWVVRCLPSVCPVLVNDNNYMQP